MCSELGRIASEPKTKWPATLLQQEEVGIGRSPPCVQQGRLLDRVQFRRVGHPRASRGRGEQRLAILGSAPKEVCCPDAVHVFVARLEAALLGRAGRRHVDRLIAGLGRAGHRLIAELGRGAGRGGVGGLIAGLGRAGHRLPAQLGRAGGGRVDCLISGLGCADRRLSAAQLSARDQC
jgi:hypothetical protein